VDLTSLAQLSLFQPEKAKLVVRSQQRTCAFLFSLAQLPLANRQFATHFRHILMHFNNNHCTIPVDWFPKSWHNCPVLNK
jgi:hypothetical protein